MEIEFMFEGFKFKAHRVGDEIHIRPVAQVLKVDMYSDKRYLLKLMGDVALEELKKNVKESENEF